MMPRRFVPSRFGTRVGNDVLQHDECHRVRTLDDTIDAVLAHGATLGITRVGETTHLDVLAIPNFSVVAPAMNYPPQPGIISVFSGKGPTREAALASALMETVERFCCRVRNEFLIAASLEVLDRRHRPVPPSAFIAPGTHSVADDEVIEWVPALDVLRGTEALVPAWLVFTPYVPAHRDLAARPSTSNGLASGNTFEEATLCALFELIERDAEAIAFKGGRATTLDLDTVDDPVAKDLIDRFRSNGLDLQVRDITQDIGVTTFLAIARDPALPQVNYVNGGKGTHLDPRIALIRALTEIAQSRALEMSGIREDMSPRVTLAEADYEAFILQNKAWYTDTDTLTPWSAFESRSSSNVVDDVAAVLDALTAAGVSSVCVVDLTQPELGIPVARVLVPSLEHDVAGAPVGPRAAKGAAA